MRTFQEGEKVLVYNFCLHLFPKKLKSRWSGHFEISKVFPYGVLELKKQDRAIFKMNAHRVKAYHEGFHRCKPLCTSPTFEQLHHLTLGS